MLIEAENIKYIASSGGLMGRKEAERWRGGSNLSAKF